MFSIMVSVEDSLKLSIKFQLSLELSLLKVGSEGWRKKASEREKIKEEKRLPSDHVTTWHEGDHTSNQRGH